MPKLLVPDASGLTGGLLAYFGTFWLLVQSGIEPLASALWGLPSLLVGSIVVPYVNARLSEERDRQKTHLNQLANRVTSATLPYVSEHWSMDGFDRMISGLARAGVFAGPTPRNELRFPQPHWSWLESHDATYRELRLGAEQAVTGFVVAWREEGARAMALLQAEDGLKDAGEESLQGGQARFDFLTSILFSYVASDEYREDASSAVEALDHDLDVGRETGQAIDDILGNRIRGAPQTELRWKASAILAMGQRDELVDLKAVCLKMVERRGLADAMARLRATHDAAKEASGGLVRGLQALESVGLKGGKCPACNP
ncbi:MAG: hypothetical protein HY556_02030 [Euryarchaeota archaeon]|nr:hypothetical protein [Euryarchaeota archaeon]